MAMESNLDWNSRLSVAPKIIVSTGHNRSVPRPEFSGVNPCFETVLVCSSCKVRVPNENLISAPDRFAQKKPYSMFELRSFLCAELSQKVSFAPSSTARLPPIVPVMWPKPTLSLAFPFG